MLLGVTSNLILYVLLIAAVIGDLRTMKVSNRLILVGIILGLFFSLVCGGMAHFIRVLPNLFFPVILLFFFFLLGAVGAGDIKLFSMIACYLEFRQLCMCIVWSFALAGAVSLVQLLLKRRFFHAMQDVFRYALDLLQGNYHVYQSREANSNNRIHFTIAILGGVLLTQGLELFGA